MTYTAGNEGVPALDEGRMPSLPAILLRASSGEPH